MGCLKFEYRNGMLFLTLPSGRKLAYVKPRVEKNAFGGESVTYLGTNAQKKWDRIESYGPKFVENIVQVISRDLLADAMQRLRDYAIVGHVHDEIIVEAPEKTSVDEICEIMSRSPAWMKEIGLKAEGYACGYYRKE